MTHAPDDLSAWIAAAEDLMNHPRHTVTPKDRKWLGGELKRFLREAARQPARPPRQADLFA